MNHINIKYIIDTSALIFLRKSNPIDIYENPWKSLSDLISTGRLITHFQVKEEITDGNDFLVDWFREQDKQYSWVYGITDYQNEIIPQIHEKYPRFIKPENKHDADPFIVALSLDKIRNPPEQTNLFEKDYYIIVTNETSKKNRNLNNPWEVVYIPDFFEIYNVECVDMFGCFRKEGWKF
jgi:hypothetical protein